MSAETRSRQPAPIAALVLDMDGLLVDSETVSGEALRLFLLGHGHEMLPSTLEGALGRRLPEAVAIVAAAYDLRRSTRRIGRRLRRHETRGAAGECRGDAGRCRTARLGRRQRLAPCPGDVQLPGSRRGLTSRGRADGAVRRRGHRRRGAIREAGARPFPAGRGEARRALLSPASFSKMRPPGLEAAARAGMRRVWVPNAHTRHLARRSRSTRRWRVSRTLSTGLSPRRGRIVA